MTTFILDAYPLVVLFQEQKGWQRVEELLERDERSPKHFMLSMINWGEVYYSFLRSDGEEIARKVINAIDRLNIEVVAPDSALTIQAAVYKSDGGLSYADCFAAALARRERATLVTGDLEFRRLEKKKQIKILWV